MEEIYNYIVHNKIGRYQLLPFEYTICGDAVYIDNGVYYSIWLKLRNCFMVDSIIHDVTGSPKLCIYSEVLGHKMFIMFIWNGYSYTNRILKTR